MGLPLEIWHQVFQRLDLPERGIRITHWPGRVPEIGGLMTEKDRLAIRALTCGDLLFEGSAIDFWLWLVPNAIWKIQTNTDIWRLTRLEASIGACARHVALELDYTGMRQSMIRKYVAKAPVDLEKLVITTELKELRTFTVNVMAPLIYRGAKFTVQLLEELRETAGDTLRNLRQCLSAENIHFDVCLFSASMLAQDADADDDDLWVHGSRIITSAWFDHIRDSDQLCREVIHLSCESVITVSPLPLMP